MSEEDRKKIIEAVKGKESETFFPAKIIWYCSKCKREMIQIISNNPPYHCYNCDREKD